MNKIKTKQINQKPIDADVHLKYRCPQPSCGSDHWISLRESQTKNFKIVCYCGQVFKPKQVDKIKIKYVDDVEVVKSSELENKKQEIPLDLQNDCVKLLVDYGFNKKESLDLVNRAWEKDDFSNVSSLIKYIFQNLGELNEFNKTTN